MSPSIEALHLKKKFVKEKEKICFEWSFFYIQIYEWKQFSFKPGLPRTWIKGKFSQ